MSHPASAIRSARALHGVIEPLHAIMYFAKEVQDRFEALGMEPRGEGYVAGRAAPMGAVGAGAATAAFYGFNPAVLQYALPAAWGKASPATILTARAEGVQEVFERVQAPTDGVAEAIELSSRATEGLDCAGRPLAAANAQVPLTGMPFADLWQVTAVLREHRGDGHLAVLLTHELGPVDAMVPYATWQDRVSRRFLQRSRMWDDDAWSAAEERLRTRGWMDTEGQLTEEGIANRDAIEAATDRLAAPPYAVLGEDDARRLFDLIRPVAAALNDGGAYPRPWTLPERF
ncbi:MAG: hypothetical protein ABGZ36_12625 [Actinomycetota bacterium]